MTKKKILFDMLRIRRVQEAIAERYAEQEMRCPTHLCIGQEAVPVGVVSALADEDIVMSHHRSHGHYLAKGGSLDGLIAEMYGKGAGCAKGWGGSQHLIDLSVNFYGSASIIGGIIPIATGTAFASKYKKSSAVTAVFFGDSVVEEGVLHETLNFASVNKLPILFVCENNLYSVQSHISARQPKRDIYAVGKAHDIESFQVDGNDVCAVSDIAERSIHNMREGKGPFFIEALTYRIREHVGPGFDHTLGYRTKDEIDSWDARCPVKLFEKKLLGDKSLSQQDIMDCETMIATEIKTVFSRALEASFPQDLEIASD